MLKDRIQELEIVNDEYKQENEKLMEENRVSIDAIWNSPNIQSPADAVETAGGGKKSAREDEMGKRKIVSILR